jgi:hypothetical protein
MDAKMYNVLDNVFNETGELIIKLKALDFNGSRRTPSTSETNVLYNSLTLVDKNSSTELKRLLTLSIVLYFQAEQDESKIKKFHGNIDFLNSGQRTSRSNINIEGLHLLFNIIEFEYKFRQLEMDKLKMLLHNMSIYEKLDKMLEDMLLYKYYVAVLNYLMKDRDTAQKNIFELICDFGDVNIENDYLLDYLCLRNSILQAKALETETDHKESLAHLEGIYETYKNKYRYNDEFNIKVGFKICDLLFEGYNFKKIYELLIGLLDITRKNILLSDRKINNFVEVYCIIVARLEFCSILLGKHDEMMRFIKKLEKTISLIKEKNMEPIKSVVGRFTYYLNVYKNIYRYKSVDVADLHNSIMEYKKINNNYLDYDSVINIYSMNPKDMVANTFYEGLYQNDFQVKSGNYTKVNFLNLFFSIFNQINKLMRDNLYESDKKKQFEIINTINSYSKGLIDYINKFIYQDKYGLFINYDYLREMLIKLQYYYIYSLYFTGDYNKALESIIAFNTLSNKLNLHMGYIVRSVSSILKVKGDIYFKRQEYKIAAENYKDVLKIYDEINIHTQMRPLVLFNLALCCINMNDVSAKEYLNQSLSKYEKLNIVHNNLYQDKTEEIQMILKYLN